MLQQRANDECRDDKDVQEDSTLSYDDDNGSVGKGYSRRRPHSWKGFMETLEWQWQWMKRTPTTVAAAGWADQIRVNCIFAIMLFIFIDEI